MSWGEIFSTDEPEPWPSADDDSCPTCGYTDKEWRGEAACSDRWHYFRRDKLREIATNILHWLDNIDQATFDMPTLREELRKALNNQKDPELRDRVEKALESSAELFRALMDINQPHRALASWGRKWSVHVGYARTSYAERKLRAITGELSRLEAARKLLETR